MKLTNVLLKQHRGWWQKLKWKYHGKRMVYDDGSEKILSERGIVVKDAVTLFGLQAPKKEEHLVKDFSFTSPSKFIFSDEDVPVHGIRQAQVLTNTNFFNGLPDDIESRIESIKIPTIIERSMNQSVLVSHLLDAEQKKHYERTPIAPHKPKHLKPREYTITDERKNSLIANRLINHCDRFYGMGSKHAVLENMRFKVPIEVGDKKVQFNIRAEFFIGSKKPINTFDSIISTPTEFPSLAPLEPTISFKSSPHQIFTLKYPILTPSIHPHTVLLDFSKGYVKNIYEKPVTDLQFEARALLKAFAITSSWAKKVYGENVTAIDKPIVLQVVQLDVKRVQFGIFQLNTLNLIPTNEKKNFWFSKPIMQLYDECIYSKGRPMLSNYNFDVLKTFCVLYGS